MSIYDKIAKKGLAESEALRREAEQEAKSLEHEIVAAAEKEAASIIAHAEDVKQNAVAQKVAMSELEKRQSVSALKNKAIDDLFLDVQNHFNGLEGKELLSFVVAQIKSEDVSGKEVMRVSKRDYDKYRKALSTEKAAKNIKLDILNEALGKGFDLTLDNLPSNEEDGFILVGDVYDLSFSVKPLLEKIRDRKEKELFESLFGDEK
ncbi:MAG: hypothetical protein EOM77_02225 [Bacteroidia bacterium]|nr:hypothetical protein [Bacteroidia bacterium]